MKNIIKNKKDVINFIIILLIMFIIFAPWLKGHFATDTYHLMSMGYKEAAESSLNDGRVLMYIIGMIGHFFNIKIEIYIVTLLILAILTRNYYNNDNKEIFRKV